MTQEQMKALPLGIRVRSVQTSAIFEKIQDVNPHSHRSSFRKVGARGLSSNISELHGVRIEHMPDTPIDSTPGQATP